MKLPERPEVGLVLCYAYLWAQEGDEGRLEGSKDRPAVVVLSRRDLGPSELVYVAPITHSPPRRPFEKVAVPAAVQRRPGLDTAAAWISATELNACSSGPDPTFDQFDVPLVGKAKKYPASMDFFRRACSTNSSGRSTGTGPPSASAQSDVSPLAKLSAKPI